MEQTKSTTCLPPQSFDFVEEDLLCCCSLYEVEDEIDQEPVDLDDNDQVETAKSEWENKDLDEKTDTSNNFSVNPLKRTMENQVVVKLNLYFSFATK